MKELGINKFDAPAGLTWIYSNSDKIDAMIAGDHNAQNAFRKLTKLLQRSAAAGKLNAIGDESTLGKAAEEGGKALVYGASGGKGLFGWRAVSAFLRNERQLAQAVSTPEGIKALNRVFEALDSGKPMSEKAWQSVMAGLTRVGVTLADDESREELFSDRPSRSSSFRQ